MRSSSSSSRSAFAGRIAALLVASLAAGATLASALEAPELVTDRPDQTESSAIVPVGGLQVELGWSAERDREGAERLDSTEQPGALVRYGLTARWELRLAWPGRIEVDRRGSGGRGSAQRVHGLADPELGVKVALASERGARPELALLAHLSLPVSGEPFGAPRADPSLRLIGAHSLASRLGLGWNLGYELASEESELGRVRTFGRFLYTAALGFDVAPRWGLFFELFGDLPASRAGAPAAHSFDVGVTWLLRPNLQLDCAAGVALDADAVDRFVGVGLSFRLPR